MTIFWNGVKTALLLGLLMGICLAVGQFWGNQGLLMGGIFGGIGVVISYFFSDKIALMSVGAKEVTREEMPEVYNLVERLADRAKLPMPRVYWAPQAAPNAFATGRNPKHGVICITDGLLKMLNTKELEGVLAHEMSHIKHRDILISTVAAIIAGAISQLAWYVMWFGGGGGRRDRDQGNALLGLLVLILAPIAAMLVQMAISRSREFAADAAGAHLAGGPEGLISALRKLEVGNRQIPMQINPSESHMFIIKPLIPGAGDMLDLFRTHPSTEKRIANLIGMLGDQNPYASTV